MKSILNLLLAMVLTLPAPLYAQAPKMEKSEVFDQPYDGWKKVLQLKNGFTFYFHFTKSEGIEVTIFDKSRKAIANKTLTSDMWDNRKLKSTLINGLYEINGEPVLFMTQSEGREPTLYRIRFNPFTGDIVKEDNLGSLPKTKIFKTVESNAIYVEKDPQSDCYAVIFFNGYASDRDERIKVTHYDGSHKVINMAYYDSPEEDFKYLRYIGSVVDGSKRVFLSTYGANSLRGRDAHVFISRLNTGDSIFTNKALDFTEDFRSTMSVMHYNHNTNNIELMTMSYSGGGVSFFTGRGVTGYMSFISYIDPETLVLNKVIPATTSKINDYAHNTLQAEKINFHGLPQQMVLNKDNSTTVLSEELTYEIVRDQRGNVISVKTFLGSIGVSEYAQDGAEKSGFVILKLQVAGGLLDPLYISSRSKGIWKYQKNAAEHNSYMSYDFAGTEKGRYIIFNDNPKNFDRDEDERRRKLATNVGKLNTICYSLHGNTVDKFLLFGDPGEDDKSNACYIEASDYQQSTNTYATILIERNHRDWQARLVWITFE